MKDANPKPLLMAFSGGKDCVLALQRLRADPEWNVVALLCTVNREHGRVAMHGIRRDVLRAQADALALPLITAEIDWPSSNEAYEAAQAQALANARQRWPALGHVAYGDLFLEDVRSYREAQLAREDFHGVFPIWGENTAQIARQFVEQGYLARLVCVDTQQLDASFCGRAFDHELLDALPEDVDPCGENGEFHTLVYAGPAFAAPLKLARGESVLRDGRFQFTDFCLTDFSVDD